MAEEMMDPVKVLVVEDVSVGAKMDELILKKLGCDVSIASTGEAALAQFKTEKFDLVFMDLGLPDIDGLAVAAAMRNLEGTSRRRTVTPIVALTGHAGDEFRKGVVQFGMNDFLPKPLTAELAEGMLKCYVKKYKPSV